VLRKTHITQLLKSSKPQLQKFGVNRIGLFGSARRNEMTKESDIDIPIDFDLEKETFANFMESCNILESIFRDHKFDIVSSKGLSPFIGPYILKDVEYV